MKIKFPKSIHVAGHEYPIEFVPNLTRDEGNRGQITWQRQLIEIDKDLADCVLPLTFWHEVLHCIDRHYNNEKLSEDDIHGFAEGLHQVLKSMGIELANKD